MLYTRSVIKNQIILALKKTLNESGINVEPLVQRTQNPDFGDYTTNVVLKAKINPSEIVRRLEKVEGIEKIEAVGGFINFWLSKEYLQNQVLEIIKQGTDYGSSNKFKGKKVSVEFISANPTGPLHIGNARGGPIGDVLSNVLSKVGYKVIREYLHNDVGGQVDKLGQTIYYTLNPDQKSDEELAYQGDYIKALALQVQKSKVQSQNDPKELGGVAVQILFEQIMDDAKAMGIKFDKVTKESDLRKEVSQVLSLIKKFLREKDGALWFAPSDEFLKDRETVVQKSDKEYTYFASDIAYHKEKMGANDLVIDVLGGNHAGHVPRLQAAIKAMGFDVSKFHVILYQFVRLKKRELAVKMAKRLGNIVTAREVLNEVGKDAFRFFLLTSGPDTHMDFDLELAKKEAQENPVFYVQYAYARLSNILEGATVNKLNTERLVEKEEMELIRELVKFPELVEEISQSFSVHLLTSYALKLADLFHRFYELHRVLVEDKDLMDSRLALLYATEIVFKQTLTLLGVEAPKRM